MIRVLPIYRCLYCGAAIEGAIMELSDRSKKDLIVDVMDMAKPMFEPHYCKGLKGAHGVVQYVGFNHISQD